jgi:hypothetical protein
LNESRHAARAYAKDICQYVPGFKRSTGPVISRLSRPPHGVTIVSEQAVFIGFFSLLIAAEPCKSLPSGESR